MTEPNRHLDRQIRRTRDNAARDLGIIRAGLTHLTAATPTATPTGPQIRTARTTIPNPVATHVTTHLDQLARIRGRIGHGHPIHNPEGQRIGWQTGLATDINHIADDIGLDHTIPRPLNTDTELVTQVHTALDRLAEAIINIWTHRHLDDVTTSFVAARYGDLHEDHIRHVRNQIFARLPAIHPNAGKRPPTCTCPGGQHCNHDTKCEQLTSGREGACPRCRKAQQRTRDRREQQAS